MARIVDPQNRELELITRFVDPGDKDVLDIGCGEGRTARRMASRGARVLGIDPDEEAIQAASVASGELSMCRFVAADVLTVELPLDSLDVVLFTRSL